MEGNLPVQSLETSFAIIEEIVDRNGAGVSELADAIDRPKSTIYDHIVTLHELMYLVRIDHEYHLSSDFLRLGDINRQQKEIYQAATDELNRLANETGEYASLAVEEHGKVILTATEEGDEAIPVHIYNGIVMHMHTAAPGKAILPYLSDDRVSDIIERHGLVERTQNTITDREELEEELEWIREHNYALDDEERLTGMRSVAAPVIDRNDRVRGSLTIYGPTNRIDDDRFYDEYPELLMRSANVVEVLTNYD
jgi:IclR family acetate operon transcriptional repressor